MKLIQRIIDRHERLKIIQLCFSANSDEQFRKRVLGNDPKSETLLMRNDIPDGQGIDRVLYFIESGQPGRGFFGEYRRLLNALYYVDVWGFVPYIVFTSKYNYSENHPVNGTSNPFEYYFEQPMVASRDCDKYRYMVSCRECDQELANKLKPSNGYDYSDRYLDELARISNKYIRFNEPTRKYLEEGIRRLIGEKKTLGVHVRLSDFKKGFYGHPTCVSADNHLRKAKEALALYGYEQVFLATDDIDTIELFRTEFGNRVVFYDDVIRTTGDVSVAFSENERYNHHYLLGLEVLRDMYTLSICQGLIAGKSQISICAMIENRNHKKYEYVEIMDDGYNEDKNKPFKM